jgi:hypothetical protein
VIIITEYAWINGYACIVLPEGVISYKDEEISQPTVIETTRNFSQLQQRKERECLRDVIKELKDRFKDKKE